MLQSANNLKINGKTLQSANLLKIRGLTLQSVKLLKFEDQRFSSNNLKNSGQTLQSANKINISILLTAWLPVCPFLNLTLHPPHPPLLILSNRARGHEDP